MGTLRKCVVWDLDNTIWDGICLENEKVTVKPEVAAAIKELDSRGILNSIASRGDEDLALSVLEKNLLKDFFLFPQINWQPKSKSILTICSKLNISPDSVAFVDDDEFELQQIIYMLPEVLTIKAGDAEHIAEYPDFSPGEITSEARNRRKFFQAEIMRNESEKKFRSRKDFLVSCEMKLTIRPITEDDIPRVTELMTRTHQLNTTGIILSKDEIKKIHLLERDKKTIIAAELEDRFGKYGIVGAAMIETVEESWKLQYLAISCRVMGRGIEKAILITLVNNALKNSFRTIEAEFFDTGRNKMMRGLYQMSGFINRNPIINSKHIIFSAIVNNLARVPDWIEVR